MQITATGVSLEGEGLCKYWLGCQCLILPTAGAFEWMLSDSVEGSYHGLPISTNCTIIYLCALSSVLYIKYGLYYVHFGRTVCYNSYRDVLRHLLSAFFRRCVHEHGYYK